MNPPFKEKTADEQCFILDQLCQVEDIDQLLGVNPYRNSQERINLFEGYTSIHVKEPSRRINYGPFAWSSLMKRDYGLRLLWDYMIEQKLPLKREMTHSYLEPKLKK